MLAPDCDTDWLWAAICAERKAKPALVVYNAMHLASYMTIIRCNTQRAVPSSSSSLLNLDHLSSFKPLNPTLPEYPHLIPIFHPFLFILLFNLKSNPLNQFLMTTLYPSPIINEIV